MTCKHIPLPFPSPVLKELRVKGDGPGEEIDPANHLISISHYDAVNDLKLNPRPGGQCKKNQLIHAFFSGDFILFCSERENGVQVLGQDRDSVGFSRVAPFSICDLVMFGTPPSPESFYLSILLPRECCQRSPCACGFLCLSTGSARQEQSCPSHASGAFHVLTSASSLKSRSKTRK